ncbi:MAG: hypothetical protein K2O32_10640 [Acetatifactor sp.]|nr:hypothetical protein [Acetatifactor sp.]
MNIERHNKIIVSLTSYPKRISCVDRVIKTLLIQTLKPDKIIIWLSKEEFPNQNMDLPTDLIELCQYGLEIRWVSGDLKSHKKYFYAMQEFEGEIIITVDDDTYYNPELIECLYNSYISHPHAVSCTRTNLICKDDMEDLSPYGDWEKKYSFYVDMEMMDLLAVGCGGVLYPPNCFELDTLCDEYSIEKYCLFQDDLWLKINEIIAGIPTVLIKEYKRLLISEIGGSQEVALYTNINRGGNDEALSKLNSYFLARTGESLYEAIFLNPNTVFNWLQERKANIDIILEKTNNYGIYIFGAGEGAKSTYECLMVCNQEERVTGFTVTNMTGNPSMLYGHPVVEIDAVKDLECLMLVSTDDKLQKEIVRLLKKRGFKYILAVDNRMIGSYNSYQKDIIKNVKNDFMALCKRF